MIYKRSWSYRGIEACIILTLQHARPNDNGNMEPFLAQLASWPNLVLELIEEVFGQNFCIWWIWQLPKG